VQACPALGLDTAESRMSARAVPVWSWRDGTVRHCRQGAVLMDGEQQIRLALAMRAQRQGVGAADGCSALSWRTAHALLNRHARRSTSHRDVHLRSVRGADSRSAKQALFGNTVITVVGDVAEASREVSVSRRTGDGPWTMDDLNRQSELLVRSGDRWLFAEKRVMRR
jgi:hypothetical protein